MKNPERQLVDPVVDGAFGAAGPVWSKLHQAGDVQSVTWADNIEATDEDRKLLADLEQLLAPWAPHRVADLLSRCPLFGTEVRTARGHGICGFAANVAMVVRTDGLRHAIQVVTELSTTHPEWIKGGQPPGRGGQAGAASG